MLEKIEEILDEKSDRWITIYKWLTVVGAIISLIYFPFAAKETVESTNYLTGRTHTEEIYDWESLCIGWALTITSFVLVMLLLNALRNLQMIREKICGEIKVNNSSNTMTPKFVYTANTNSKVSTSRAIEPISKAVEPVSKSVEPVSNKPSYESVTELIKTKEYEKALAQLAVLDSNLYDSIRTLLENGEEENAIVILENM